MFLAAQTPSARIKGFNYPHNLSCIPAMHNELEQVGITNKRILLHSFHAAFAVFQKAYGWSFTTYLESALSMVTGRDLDDLLPNSKGMGLIPRESTPKKKGTIQSGLSMTCLSLNASDNMPSTQKYVSDHWGARNPLDKKGVWFPIMGEDWGHANATRAVWDAKTSFGSPSGKNDCESSDHANMSKYLAYLDLAVPHDPLQTKANVWKKVYGKSQRRNSVSKKFVGLASQDIKMSLQEFIQDRLEYYSASDKIDMDDEAYVDALTIQALLLHPQTGLLSFDTVLGTAFSAKQDTTKVPTSNQPKDDNRPVGGHAYGITTYTCPQISSMTASKYDLTPMPNNSLEKLTLINEGTACVVNRVFVESSDHSKSVMLSEKAFCVIMEANKTLGDPWHNVESRPLMTSSSKDAAKDFYDKIFVFSRYVHDWISENVPVIPVMHGVD